MTDHEQRIRGEAFAGHGYGTLRFELLSSARRHIEQSIDQGFYCEAIAIIESAISDRLESRLSFLSGRNRGFKTLGWLITHLRECENDAEMNQILNLLDDWRKKRNGAMHELVKVQADRPKMCWAERMEELAVSAKVGYELLLRVYHRVAGLNPLHSDRVFPFPVSEQPGANRRDELT